MTGDRTRDITQTPFLRQAGAALVIVEGPDRGKSVRLDDRPVAIGSGSECDSVLTDRTVSRVHLTAHCDGAGVVLRDQGSRNGSVFEGSRFREITVGFGAELRLGRTVLKCLPVEESVAPDAASGTAFGALLGESFVMRQLFELLAGVAKTEATVLLEGETGTGKELVAQEIHEHSRRASGPFVVCDCGALQRELVASALFGHVRGAFTGAVAPRRGAFVESHGGTIFLDEIGELPLELQPALLRVLDKKVVQRVGADSYEPVDVRIIAATNRSLRDEVARKSFREDLYFRLAVMHIRLPSLRERTEDIASLVEHFIRQLGGGRKLRVRPEDIELLERAPWPGNVRELRNVIERACGAVSGEFLGIVGALQGSVQRSLPPSVAPPGMPFREAREHVVGGFERDYFADLLARHGGNLSAAAREARIDRKYLRDLLKRYGLRGRD